MNTSFVSRAVSFSFAVVLTVMTLAGVDGLARQEPTPALMARTVASSPA